MQLPPLFIESLQGTEGFDKEAFEKVHASGERVTSVRINPAKPALPNGETYDPLAGGSSTSAIPWSRYGYYLATRPSFTFDPFFHAGCYYVQEASSMFLEQAFVQLLDLSSPLKILDLSAAPGGKSTHIQSLLGPQSLLVSNEVIRARANILQDNIIKWGAPNVIVTQNDPRDFSRLGGYFDVIVVDAPCSGSGLFRRDPQAMEEWSPQHVELCSQRQRRILADAWPSLKEGGLLVYSTCSYSSQEDEDIVAWMKKDFAVDYLPLSIDPAWGITDTGNGFRFWPDKVKGEGFFLSCFRKTAGEPGVFPRSKNKIDRLEKKEQMMVEKWVDSSELEFVKHLNTVYAWPVNLFNDCAWILQQLKVIYSGIMIGELMRDKLVPSHALAMTNKVATSIPRISLDSSRAIQFLQRKELDWSVQDKGWHLVEYEGKILGWANVLSHRVNNYYPKELRILKES